jgi:hypothetical protein
MEPGREEVVRTFAVAARAAAVYLAIAVALATLADAIAADSAIVATGLHGLAMGVAKPITADAAVGNAVVGSPTAIVVDTVANLFLRDLCAAIGEPLSRALTRTTALAGIARRRAGCHQTQLHRSIAASTKAFLRAALPGRLSLDGDGITAFEGAGTIAIFCTVCAAERRHQSVAIQVFVPNADVGYSANALAIRTPLTGPAEPCKS